MTDRELMQQALEALDVALDNLRPHGDNCFLHDEGEYNRCFCGKDSLENHLQSVVEKLDDALRERLAQPEQAWITAGAHTAPLRTHWEGCEEVHPECKTRRREWVGLTGEEKLHLEIMGGKSDVMLAEAIEAKLKGKNA